MLDELKRKIYDKNPDIVHKTHNNQFHRYDYSYDKIELKHVLLAIARTLNNWDVLNSHINSYGKLTFRTLADHGLFDYEIDKSFEDQKEQMIEFLNSVIS